MLGLAIDSADRVASAVLWRSDAGALAGRGGSARAGGAIDLIDREALAPEAGKADQVISVIETLLQRRGFGYADLEILAVNRGPGSFTGIRSAVALVRGLALAAGLPVLAVTGHDALAARLGRGAGEDGCSLMAVLDARRGEVYAQAFSPDGVPLSAIEAFAPAAVAATLEAGTWHLAGSGAGLVAASLSSAAAVRLIETAPIDATAVALAASARLAQGEKPVPGTALKPLYVREPDAVPPAPLISAIATAGARI